MLGKWAGSQTVATPGPLEGGNEKCSNIAQWWYSKTLIHLGVAM